MARRRRRHLPAGAVTTRAAKKLKQARFFLHLLQVENQNPADKDWSPSRPI